MKIFSKEKEIFLCNNEVNPERFLKNLEDWKESVFPDGINEIITGKNGYYDIYSKGITLSYAANNNQKVELYINSFEVKNVNELEFTAYIIGNNSEFELVRNELVRNRNISNYIIRKLKTSYNIKELINLKKQKNQLKELLKIQDADALYLVLNLEELEILSVIELFSGKIIQFIGDEN